MKFTFIIFAIMAFFEGRGYAKSLTINCNNLGGLTESLSIIQTDSQTDFSMKSVKARTLLENLIGKNSISGLVTRLDFSIPRSCRISKENAFSFYCPAQDVTLTFSGDQVIDIRNQDIGFGIGYKMDIGYSHRVESVTGGLSVYTNSKASPFYPNLAPTFVVYESHSGELSNPSKSIIGKKCSVASN
jgi:hypothetical protein